jgi:hypothetical protein
LIRDRYAEYAVSGEAPASLRGFLSLLCSENQEP